MPTPEALDIEALLAPIPGDDPAGGSVPYTIREQLDPLRKEVDPSSFSVKDPMRPTEPKLADWPTIVEIAGETLRHSSKDLLLVARLIEGETKLRGFAGMRDSLRLARRLLDEAWDRLRPPIEEPDDIEVRAAALNWLDDSSRGARFPATVRSTPLIVGPLGALSWVDWTQSQKDKATAEQTENVIKSTPREVCQLAVDDLDEIVAELGLILGLCNDKMGPAGPGMVQVRQAIVECRTLAGQILDRKGPAPVVAQQPEPDEELATDGAEPSGTGPERGGLNRIISNRGQAYQHLVEVANALEQIEPHSPIPHIIRRAVALGQLSFPDLMKELIKDAAVLTEMSRNLGIKELQQE